MKKLSHILIVLTVSLLLCNCRFADTYEGSIIYWPEKIDSKITEKTHVKPFDKLKGPIVVALPLYEKHNLFGVENWGSKTWQIGNILVVFDMETESIYDWAFSKGSLGWNDYQMLPIKNTWWISGENGVATKLDACTGEISVYEHGISSRIHCFDSNNNSFILEEGIYDSEKNKRVTKVYSFNVDKGELEYNWIFCDDDGLEDFRCDLDGNFYTCYQKEKRNYFAKLRNNGEFEESEIIEDWENDKMHIYNMRYVDTNYLYIHAHEMQNDTNPRYPCMLKYDFNTHIFSQIDISSVKEAKYGVYPGVNVNKKIYFICLSEKWGESLKFGLYNSENNKIELLEPTLADNFTGWPYVYGTKIFLLNWWNSQELKYEWFDTKTGKYINPITITLDDILKN